MAENEFQATPAHGMWSWGFYEAPLLPYLLQKYKSYYRIEVDLLTNGAANDTANVLKVSAFHVHRWEQAFNRHIMLLFQQLRN